MAGQTFNMPTPPQNTYPFQPQYASQDGEDARKIVMEENQKLRNMM
ncbi:hypothetical protein COLO4_02898 [Corchorus olitorius]|uniref:Uncharacterized protein n=1 Tax=Corchorus olitorius TaxID=93759 RepID=A0A1R3L074_9ROSI|nr:hypothetical protein COLO4_02898 [Corchorus olitorius]